MKEIQSIKLGIEDLREIAQAIRIKTRYGVIPTWIFDLEKCGSGLSLAFRKESRSLGYSGNTKDRPPELEKLRSAIVKIGGLCASGGFALSRDAIFSILCSAINDLEQFVDERQ